MVSPYAPLITPAIHALTIAITVISAYHIYRQRSTAYNYVKNLLVIVYFVFMSVVVSEFVRVNYDVIFGGPPTAEFMRLYTEGGVTFILLDVLLLTIASAAIYFRPSGSFIDIFGDIVKHTWHRIAFFGFASYIVLAALILILFRPYSIIALDNLWGVRIYSTSFSYPYLVVLLIVLIFFLAYPSILLIAAARKAPEQAIRRALIILPICWTLIGLDLMIFNGYLWTAGIDANDAGYLVAATVFSITAIVFRRASVLAGFFNVTPAVLEVRVEYPFSKRIGVGKTFLTKRNILLEVDPSTDYEKVVKDFAVEVLSNRYVLFAFTSKGSPIYKALSDVQGVIGITRFFVMTDRVSYPRPAEGQVYEVLVPQHDQPVLLDVLDKTLKGNPESNIAVVFDSVSDLIISLGLEKAYGFLKHANEIMSDPRITSLFLLSRAAHDDKTMNLVRTLFADHLSYDSSGLKVTKKA
ncbi:MAG: hypothetical protein HYU02_05825 [Thaumarchaeota archaeon]|nr:hypothetical protein [Nitrososphaerota archaeon]